MKCASCRCALLGALIAAGCNSPEQPPAEHIAQPDTITANILGSLTYSVAGLGDRDSVTLTRGAHNDTTDGMRVEVFLMDGDGRVLDSASRVTAADLDGDGRPEGVVIVHSWLGGTGQFYRMVVVGSRDTARGSRWAERASIDLGDRVKIDSVRVIPAQSGQVIRVALLHHGEGDGACCPTRRSLWDFVFTRASGTGPDSLKLVRDTLLSRDSSALQ